MKKLAWVLMFCCGAAYGQEWVARIANKSGGNVVLLGFKGGCQNGMRVYTNTFSGAVAWGCWVPTDNDIMVFWDDGETRFSIYPYTGWEINPNSKKKDPKSF